MYLWSLILMNNYYFDKLIKVTLYKVDERGEISKNPKDILEITNTSSSLKPNISFEVSELPQQLCYQATVKIMNFMYTPDIKKYEYMSIEAGYSSRTVQFNIAVFTSYQESPNPDGVTVFKGVTTGTTNAFITPRSIHVTIHSETSVKTIIERVAIGASGYEYATDYFTGGASNVIKVLNNLPDELSSLKIKPSKKLTGDNGLALLADLYTTLYAFFKKMGYTYVQQLYNGTLSVGVLGYDKRPDSVESVLPIITVYSASFNAQILTLIAPWDPLAEPGRIVKISANYFNGNMTPNVLGNLLAPAQLSIKDLGSSEGLYRILTCKINFSTCEDTNKMELLLIPISYSKQDVSSLSEDDTTLKAYENLKKGVEKSLEIEIGVPDSQKTTEQLFSSGVKGSYTYTEETLDVGTTFTALAIKYYDTVDTKDFFLGKKAFNKEIVTRIEDDGTLVKAKYPSATLGIAVGRSWAWPLILAATYTAYKMGDPKYKVSLDDPDALPPGTTVRIPVLPSGNEEATTQLKADKDLFKAMGDYYINYINDKSKWWAREHAIRAYNMYLLAGGDL